MLAIDLFSGCGGLSLGLKRSGLQVISAIELDPIAVSSYKKNHSYAQAQIINDDISGVDISRIRKNLNLRKGDLTILAGCPPCQGFSSLRTLNGRKKVSDENNDLVFEFIKFAHEFRPKAIMLENVPGLLRDERFDDLTLELSKLGYFVNARVANAADYGVPQNRKRAILLAGHGFVPSFPEKKKRARTVRDAIGDLEEAEQSLDVLHNYRTSRSRHINELIQLIPKDGGSRADLPENFVLSCHKKTNGFKDVYGRLKWDFPSSTITSGCINPSKGRFLHPEKDRAITLREAALLQGFPLRYKFDLSKGTYKVAQMIGNAFPPAFAQVHAKYLLAQC